MDDLRLHDPIDVEDCLSIDAGDDYVYLSVCEVRLGELQSACLRLNRDTAKELRNYLNKFLERLT